MTLPEFDGSKYRQTVLTPLRERNPAEVEDLFWLGGIPRELDDGKTITTRLKLVKGFLNKERSRQRQAAVSAAVLKEWPRVESVLTDASSRNALRQRLHGTAAPEAAAPTAPRRRSLQPADPVARRRRQTAENLQELARLRNEPELADDLFAFLGLSVNATSAAIEKRIEQIVEVNRRRRPDREKTLVDSLLGHSREFLVSGDPAAYLNGFADDARDGVVDALLAADLAQLAPAHDYAAEIGVGDADILERVREPAARSSTPVPISRLGLGTWCASCGVIAAPGVGTCTKCGESLTIPCPACRTVNPVDSVACVSCEASLADALAALAGQRKSREAETDAIAQVDRAPESARPELLARLTREHPEWLRLRHRLANLPPAPPTSVRVATVSDGNRIVWDASEEAGVDGYLVERHEGANVRVLGRTATTVWVDPRPVGSAKVRWSVRALRGDVAASEPADAVQMAAPAPPRALPRVLTDVRARANVPVELSWVAPPGGLVRMERTEHRTEGDVVRHLTVGASGYSDRHVGRDRAYEYRIILENGPGDPVVLHVAAGSGAIVTPTSSAPTPPARPARTSPPPPVPSVSPAHAQRSAGPAFDGVSVARESDGALRVRWNWTNGVTEAFVAFGERPVQAAPASGRKITRSRYEADDGALLLAVPHGAHVAVFPGQRAADGKVVWGTAPPGARAVAP